MKGSGVFNPSHSAFRLPPSALPRRGMTLIELMISVTILSITIAAVGVLARAVQISAEYNEGYGTATQHARVTLDRLDKAINQAYANKTYPGAWTTVDVISSFDFPDTLVVWRPSGTPANPDGAPLASELVLFCPDPTAPNKLLEVTVPGDNRTMPSPSGAATFKTFVDGLKTAAGAQKAQLTDLVRTTAISGSANPRAAVRFVVTKNPTDSEMLWYPSVTWMNLPWPQSICGPATGLRQVWVRTELQLMPYGQWIATNAAAQQAVPYFGSSTFCYEMTP
jgi:prepilin-type N-terminal cleavage/methylation domain-containing protein